MIITKEKPISINQDAVENDMSISLSSTYIKIDHDLYDIMEDSQISVFGCAVYLKLTLGIKKYGNVSQLSIDKIARSMKTSKRKVIDAIRELEEANLVTTTKVSKCNLYQLQFSFMGHKKTTKEVCDYNQKNTFEMNTISSASEPINSVISSDVGTGLASLNKLTIQKATTTNTSHLSKSEYLTNPITSAQRQLVDEYVGLLEKRKIRFFRTAISRKLYLKKTLREVSERNEWEIIEAKIKDLSYTKRSKKNRPKIECGEFEKLRFKTNSFFAKISSEKWGRWIRKYGFETVQNRLAFLDRTTTKIIKSAEALMAVSLRDGEHWESERESLEQAKQFEKDWEIEKRKERDDALSMFSDSDAEYDLDYSDPEVGSVSSVEGRGEIPISEEKIQELEKDEEDYKKAILDEGIREMAMESLRKDHTTIDFTNPFGRSLLKSSIIELYRKKTQ